MFKEELINLVSLVGVKEGSISVREDGKEPYDHLQPEGSASLTEALKLRDLLEIELMELSARQHLVLKDLQVVLEAVDQHFQAQLVGMPVESLKAQEITDRYGASAQMLSLLFEELEQAVEQSH